MAKLSWEQVAKLWWLAFLAVAGVAGTVITLLVWDVGPIERSCVLGAVVGIPSLAAAFGAGRLYAERTDAVTAGLLDDGRRLGIVRILRRGEVSGRIPSIRDFLQTAEQEILMPVYAPTEVKIHYETLIAKVNPPSEVRVAVILPDPRNHVLMEQVAGFAEGRRDYLDDFKASFRAMKRCWEKASDKSRFRVYVFNGMLMFAGIIVDRKRATISFQAQGWGLGKRVLLQLDEGPLLRACLETCQSICESSSTVTLGDAGDYDRFMAAVEELS